MSIKDIELGMYVRTKDGIKTIDATQIVKGDSIYSIVTKEYFEKGKFIL